MFKLKRKIIQGITFEYKKMDIKYEKYISNVFNMYWNRDSHLHPFN